MDHRRAFLDRYATEKTEVQFMKEVLTPLFDSMSFKRVKFNHGDMELGKDYILSKTNAFGQNEYTAVVVKNGDISNTSAKNKTTLAEVERQVDQSFKNQIEEPGCQKSRPAKVIVVCSGRITDSAEKQIIESLPTSYSSANLDFIAADRLIQLIEQYLPKLFEFEIPALGIYLESLANKVKEECCGDSKFSEIVGKIELLCNKVEHEVKTDGSHSTKQNSKVTVNSILENGKTVWLQGGNGSGKTFSAYQFISAEVKHQKEVKRLDTPYKVFFLLTANKLSTLASSKSLESFLTDLVRPYYPEANESQIAEWIKKYKVVFIVERFEKTPDPRLIDALIEAFEFNLVHPTVLILSRIIGDVHFNFKRRPQVYYIRDLDMNDAIQLINKTIQNKSAQAKSAFQDLIKNGALERIPRTPLAINVLSHVFSEQIDSTPNNMYEFFDMFFELVLGRWRFGRQLGKSFDYMQVRSFLESSAYQIIESNDTSISIQNLVPTAQQILSGVSDETSDPIQYIRELCIGSEIVKIENERFEFQHRTYLEFLSGCYYMKHKWTDESYIKNIINPGWEYTLVFAAGGKKESDSLLTSLHKIDDSNFENQFLKIKNISLTLQALYQSKEQPKLDALDASLETACKFRDDPSLEIYTKVKFTQNSNLFASLIALGTYALFYNRSTLGNIMQKKLQMLGSGRKRPYLISALSMTENTQRIGFLNKYLETFTVGLNEPETLALEPFLKGMEKTGRNLTSLKAVLSSKKMKQLGKKVQAQLSPQKWYSRFSKKHRS